MIGTFVATFLSLSAAVYAFYPDMPAYPREFEGGLERELGGPGAMRVCPILLRPYSIMTDMQQPGENGGRRRSVGLTTTVNGITTNRLLCLYFD